MKLPDFFIAGAPKCGTTSLYNWLGGHPQIHAPHKEACFFSQDIFPTSGLPTHIFDLEEYCRIFSPGDGKSVSGEATPKYLYSDLALSEIARLNPDARIILCLRDPVEIAISLYNQKLREGVERAATFEDAWRSSLNAIAGNDPRLPHERNYYLWACVGERLRMLHSFFSRESVLILLTSELKEDPRACYLEVLSFLGLPDDGRTDFFAHNERVGIRNLWLHRFLLSIRKKFYSLLKPIWAFRNGKGLGVIKFINNFNTKKRRYTASVSASLKSEMYAVLVKDIELAETYLNGRSLVKRKES